MGLGVSPQMAEAAVLGDFGGSLGGPPPGPGPLQQLGRALLSSAGRRLRRAGTPPGGPRSWLVLGVAVGLCQAAGLDPSLGLLGAIARGLPQSALLPGALRSPLALLLFSSGLWLLLALTLRLGLRLLLGGLRGALARPGPPPRLWLALVRMFAGRRPGLRSLQGALPALPLPPLEQTVRQAVESLQALGPGGAGEGLPPLARSFLGGPGPRLQRWLRLRRCALPCYLSDLWEEQILGCRGPLPSTSSYYLMDVLGPPPTRLPAARAANVAFAFGRFRSLVRAGTLPPVLFRGSLPTCSAQYERLFDTTRLPGEPRDRLRTVSGSPPHVAVLCGGRLFRVALGGAGGRPRSPPELQRSFQKVLEQRGRGGAPPESPALLTAGDRSRWARARAQLLARGGPGAAALGVLEGAAFVVAFDPPPAPPGEPPRAGDPPEEREPPRDGDLDLEAKALLVGPPGNRWFDKSLTLVVFPSGRVGLSVEHSWGDPPVAGHLWEFSLALDLALGYGAGGSCLGGGQGRAPEPPQELPWGLQPQVSALLPQALQQFRAVAEGLQLHVASVETPPGPPESAQELLALALELALVRERGPALTYEPIPTRLFLEGRADGARGVGRPLLELERALRDPQTPPGRRRALLEAALAQARGRRRAAMTGAGLERHLQALAAVANQMKLRPPFLTQVLGQPWALAFSPAPRPHPPLLPLPLQPAGGGFNPPHPDGYGVSFVGGGAAGPALVHISCREGSPRTDPLALARGLRSALGELRALLGGEGPTESPEPPLPPQ